MTDDAKQAWSEVGDRFASWGRRVAERYRETEEPAGGEGTSEEKERELERAAKELVDELGRGVSALADTVRDDEAKKELTEAFKAMGDAITATFDEAREGIRARRRSDDSPTPPEPPTPPAPPEP